jgi:hypothetical protein
MLAFGDELLVLPDDNYEWRTPGGRDLAAAYLLPRAETALRRSCSGWPTPPREREGRSSSSSGIGTSRPPRSSARGSLPGSPMARARRGPRRPQRGRENSTPRVNIKSW